MPTRRADEEDEDRDGRNESPPRAGRRVSASRVPDPPPARKVMRVIRMGVWAVAGLLLFLLGVMFIDTLGGAQSAPQQGAIGAVYGARAVFVYALARAADQFFESLERATERAAP